MIDSNSAQELQMRRQHLLGSAYRLFYDEPLHIVEGRGVWLTAADGQRYLDCYNNVPHVGHCHPWVTDALCRQARRLNTHTRYLHETVLDYAERLTGRLPEGLDVTMFACSGTEANELALRIARAATGAEGVIVTRNAYHGNSTAIAAISPEDQPAGLPDHVETIPAPDPFRGGFGGADAASRYGLEMERAIDRLRTRGHRPAAFFVDTVLSSEGIPAVPAGCLAAAAERLRAAGGLFVADEVQAGFGRTGNHFWGFEHHLPAPDLVTMGKPMANGHPVSAVVTTAELNRAFSRKAHYFNTFGGNPVSCAAARAVLEVMEAEGLQARACEVGGALRRGLEAMARTQPLIGEVRGAGLFIGVDLVRDRASREPARQAAHAVYNRLRELGVLIGVTGPAQNVLKIRPPLVFDSEHAAHLLAALDQALSENADS